MNDGENKHQFHRTLYPAEDYRNNMDKSHK
jgi:hypothetical protein